MAPKAKQKAPPEPAPATEYKTIGAKREAEYLASRPLQVLFESKGYAGLSRAEQTAYANFKILDTGAYRDWTPAQQKEFAKICEQQKISRPLPRPRDLGVDHSGKRLEDYTPAEYKAWEELQSKLDILRRESEYFKRRHRAERLRARALLNPRPKILRRVDSDAEVAGETTKEVVKAQELLTEDEIVQEKERRKEIAVMSAGKQPGHYSGDPEWDDVVPIPQDDGENPLAAIAYTEEYSEAISYLRAVMAAQEHTPRILDLTAHIISLNPAHYTVWLYRASTLFALQSDLAAELDWVNEVALDNQKNYQIWHHRQLLIDNLYPRLISPAEIRDLARTEVEFLTQMFEEDSKNYHVWSYRQYLVRKLDLFPSQCDDPSELASLEALIRSDVRNNSAWSHRFFVVFSDPGFSTPGSKATSHDPMLPDSLLDREIEFSKSAIWDAPQNQSPWNYLRGVLRKGGRELKTQECFASEFVKLGDTADGAFGKEGEEVVKSSHALDFLADVWMEKGEHMKADRALWLLGSKYDRVRKNYWDWKRTAFSEG